MNELKPKKHSFLNFAPYLTAFLVPVIVMLVVFIQRGIWPFGGKCFLRTDLYHQYAPFFKELRTKLTTGGSLFYSWNIGGGTNFWALSAYYLSSPANLLVALCPEDYVIEFVTALIVIKIGLCSVTMTYYLNKRQGKSGADAFPAVFFGLFYALSGWMAAYNWNVMWLDCIWLFPLIILGLERLVKENKGLLYSVTLGFCIFTNYYIAIMVCMGVALYCFFLLCTERAILRDFGIKLLKFVFYTGLAVGLSAVFLFPYIRYFSMTASASSTFKWEWYSYFSVVDMISRELMNVEVHTGLEHWPNIYAGVAVFMLIPLYYLNRKVTLREKIGYTVLLVFFYFSFSTRAMDYIWHVLHIPNSLPCRQSFIFIFLVLTMSYRGFTGIKDRTYRDLAFSMLAALAFIFLAEALEADKEVIKNYVIYLSAAFVLIYAILFYTYRRGRTYTDVIITLLIAVAAVEACVNTSVTSVPTVTRSDYVCFDEGVSHAMSVIRDKEDENAFYRVEKQQLRTKNDGAWLNFPSISTFSSVANARLSDFYKTIGLEASTNAYGSFGQTFFTNMLMNVKYSIYQKAQPESDLYTLVDTNGRNVWVYENTYTLPLGYLFTDPFITESWKDTAVTPLDNQNQLAENILGSGEVFENVTPDYAAAKDVYLTVEKDGFYYAYSAKSGPKEIKVSHANGSFSRIFKNLNRGYTMELGFCKANDVITFSNEESNSQKSCNVTLFRLSEPTLKKVYNELSKCTLTVDTYEDTRITAHVDVPENGGLLMTTVAAEEGWTVLVDGEKTAYRKIKDAYIGLDLKAGHHTIEFVYRVPLFTVSLVISLVSGFIMLLLAFYPLLKDKLFKKKEKAPQKEEDAENEIPVSAPVPASSEPETEPQPEEQMIFSEVISPK